MIYLTGDNSAVDWLSGIKSFMKGKQKNEL